MAAAAYSELPYPETSIVDEGSLAEQSAALAAELPERPLVLGGCCCAHVGAVQGLAAREGALAVVWIDAHGDLNTPATSPSGNAWGMPLRMLIDAGVVPPVNVALLGARNLDAPEVEFIESSGIQTGERAVERALAGTEVVYVALDCDSVEPGELEVFMPEPDGLRLDELRRILGDIAERKRVAGAGLTGLVEAEANQSKLVQLASALGL